MAKEFSVIIEQDTEGYYVASVPALRGCHTKAKSLDELMVRVREAVELCLEVPSEVVSHLVWKIESAVSGRGVPVPVENLRRSFRQRVHSIT